MSEATHPLHVVVLGLRGFPDVQGGVERHAEHLYPLLVKSGCRIDVITRASYMPGKLRSWRGVTFHHLWVPRVRGVEALLHSIIGVIYAGIMRPDILHIHAVGPAIVAPLARIMGLNIVVTHHGPDYDREKWGAFARRLLRLGEKWGMSYAHQRIVISDVIRKLVFDSYRLDTTVIPNGVSLPVSTDTMEALDKFSLTADHYILLVSRFVPEKRHLDLIEAFNMADLPGWKLALVGEVDRSDAYCRKVMTSAERTPGVVITDYQSGKALNELYAHAGIFVLPSSHEGLPIALLEALSYGLPVLASAIPANLEVGLSDKLYFPLGDTTVLAEALRRLANDGNDELQRRDRQMWVEERYDWSRIASRTLEIYRMAAPT